MRRLYAVVPVAVGMALMIGGCSSTSSQDSAPSEPAATTQSPAASSGASTAPSTSAVEFAELLALTFTSQSVTEDGAAVTLASDAPVTLTFSEDTVSAKAGCNTHFGTATITDGQLVIDGQLASTMMACDQALMDQDAWLAAFLMSGPQVGRDGDLLTLESPTVTMTFAPVETVGMYDTPLHGPEAFEVVQAMCDDLVASGASVDEARATAEVEGYVLRIVKQDGEFGPATMDLNPGRLNLTVEQDVVTGCTAG